MKNLEHRVMEPDWRKKYLMTDMAYTTLEGWLKATDMVLFPTGVVEQHGPHLPMAADYYQAALVACAVAEKAELPVAPGLWFAPIPYNLGRVGAVTIREHTMFELLYDIYRSLIHHGFKKIVTLSGHVSAQSVVDQVARKIKYETGALVIQVVPFLIAAEMSAAKFDTPTKQFMLPARHGGEVETGGILAWNEDLVNAEAAPDGPTVTPPWLPEELKPIRAANVTFKGYSLGLQMENDEYAPTGIVGSGKVDPEVASTVYDPVVDWMVELMGQLRKIDVQIRDREFTNRV